MGRIGRSGTLGEAPWVYSPKDTYDWALKGQTGGDPLDPDGTVLTDVSIRYTLPEKVRSPKLARRIWQEGRVPDAPPDDELMYLSVIEHILRVSRVVGLTGAVRLVIGDHVHYNDPSVPLRLASVLRKIVEGWKEDRDAPRITVDVLSLKVLSAVLSSMIRRKRGGSWIIEQEVVGTIRASTLTSSQKELERRIPGIRAR